MNLSRRVAPLALVLVAALCSSCGSLLNLQRTPFTIYSPTYNPPAASGSVATVNWQLAIETPLASDTLDSARIAVMPTPGTLEVFPGARWREPAPALLRGMVVQGFETSGRIVGVGSAASGLRADYSLAIELRDFQLEFRDGKPLAAIRFQARLLDYTSNRVLASRAFTAESPSAGADAASAFVAFETALNTIVPELVDWTLREGAAAQGKPATRP